MKFFILIILIFTLFSCDEKPTVTFVCGVGEIKACNCDNGSSGKQTCLDNKWGECICEIDERCKDVTCSSNGECVIKDNAAACECNDGYHAQNLNCIKDGDVDPCKNHNCVENSHCTVENDAPKCVCDVDYIELNGNCLFDCTNLEFSHPNEANNACECDRGYHFDVDNCVQDDDFKCLDYECSDTNSHCIVDNSNGTETAMCICDLGFVDENGICTLDCTSFENSTPNSDNTNCICKAGFHFENNLCVSDVKNVNCNDITLPENSYQVNVDVSISWTQENGWETPIDCLWECNEGYQDKDGNNTCLPACLESSCENGVCNDDTGVLDCTCNQGYQDKDNNETCLPNCESTIVDGIECGGQGTCHDDTGVITCICDSHYQDNDNDGICKKACYVNILRPELSTCGKYGTCNDSSGETVCSCENGYFVSPVTGKCIAPCENIDCGRHGRCQAIGLNSMSCDCDTGYQDYDGDLICKKSCDSSCIENSLSCNDSTGNLVCECDLAYQDNDMDGTCLLDCSNTLCNASKQIPNSCDDSSGFPVCEYENGYNYTFIVSGTNDQIVNDSVFDSNGNLYFVGSFKGTVDFDYTDGVDSRISSGDEDIFITRINSDGSYAWTYSIGAGSIDGATSISIDNYNNLYITGYFSSTVDFDPVSGINFYSPMRSEGYRDVFILKISSNGIYDWGKSFGSVETDIPTSITLDSNSIYLTGTFEENIDFDRTGNGGEFSIKGRKDGFISKFDIIDGTYLWAKTFGDTSRFNSVETAIVFNDNLYVTGQINGSVDFNSDGDTPQIISSDSFDAFILKISKNGAFDWVKELKTLSSSGVSSGKAFRVVGNELYLVGFLSGEVDFDTSDAVDILDGGINNSIFVSKINEDGSIGSKTIFISSNENAQVSDISSYNGKIYITGSFQGSLNFQGNIINNTSSLASDRDAFIVSFDTDFTINNVISFGGALDDTINTISISNSGILYSLGNFEDTVDFDPTASVNNKTSTGLKDIFISRFTE